MSRRRGFQGAGEQPGVRLAALGAAKAVSAAAAERGAGERARRADRRVGGRVPDTEGSAEPAKGLSTPAV